MLIDFKFSNFKSFKNETIFSLEPASHNGKPINEIEIGYKNIKSVFKTSAIFGANASGKSNLVDAMCFFKDIVSNSFTNAIDSKFDLKRYALGKDNNKPSSFEIRFVKNNYIYRYGFSLNETTIFSEYLYYSDIKSSKEIIIFKREINRNSAIFEESTANNEMIPNGQWILETIKTRLFLSELVNNRNANNEHIQNAYWNIKEITVMKTNVSLNSYVASSTKIKNNLEKKHVIDFLNKADFNISDIKYNDVGYDDFIKSRINELVSTHKTEDGRNIDFNFHSFESDGTKVVFSLSGIILKILETGQTLIIDEMDKSLHPLLVRYIVNMFNSPDTNKKNAQLIFTSHSHYLMDGETLSRDQIWFTSKENGFYSQLYSLGDFKELKRKKDNFYNEYMYGIFGAIPNINEDL